MYQYKEKPHGSALIVRKHVKKTDKRQPQTVNPMWLKEPAESNIGFGVVQGCGMITRSMERAKQKDGLVTGEAIGVQRILQSSVTLGRKQLYPYSFEPIELTEYDCSACGTKHQSIDNPPTVDHRRPLASIFESEWPGSLYKSVRKEQFYREENQQLMCRSGNSSKGSGGVEYDQRYAAACMAFGRVGEKPELEEVFDNYGSGQIEAEQVVEAVERYFSK